MHPARVATLLLTAAFLTPSSGWATDRTHTTETPIVVRVDERGFAWPDAFVGAVAGIGATLVAAGGVALLRPGRSALESREGS
jgi:hypothetical protein